MYSVDAQYKTIDTNDVTAMYSVNAQYKTIDTDDVTAMYSVNAQYKTIHHNTKVNDDNDNMIPSAITKRKQKNARDAHNTNQNYDVRNVNSKTEVNDDNNTKVNDDNDNNNYSSCNNHRKFRHEKHKYYQQQHLIFP